MSALPMMIAAAVQTMSSREIAELTGKEHKHVIRDIRVMVEALKDGPDLGHVTETKDGRGYTSAFLLPKRETLILVSGYDVHLRARIIDRWQQLEEQAFTALPHDYPSALRALADSTERVRLLEAKLLAVDQALRLTTDNVRYSSKRQPWNIQNRVLAIISGAGPHGITKGDLSRRTQFIKGYERKAVIRRLIDAGAIFGVCSQNAHIGRPLTTYYSN